MSSTQMVDQFGPPPKDPCFLPQVFCFCCIRNDWFSSSFFSWRRTYLFRFVMAFYVFFGTVLCFAWIIQFLSSVLIEYVITCIVFAANGYILGLLVVPMLFLVILVIVEYGYLSVIISISTNCDKNGNLETQTMGNSVFAISEQLDQLAAAQNTSISELNEFDNDTNMTHLSSINSLIQYSYRTGANANINEVTVEKSGSLRNKSKQASNIAVSSMNEFLIATDHLSQGKTKEEEEKEASESSKLVQVRSKFLKLYDFKGKLPDYYLATCWRLWIFIISLLYAFSICMTVGEEVDISAQYWSIWFTALMQTCGLITPLLLLFSWLHAFLAHCRQWKQIHDLPRWHYFFMLDPSDNEKFSNGVIGWRSFKIILSGFLVFAIFFFIIGYFAFAFDGFFMFMAIVFVLYLVSNYYTISKGHALVALWRNDLPPPSSNLEAHEKASVVLSLVSVMFLFCCVFFCNTIR